MLPTIFNDDVIKVKVSPHDAQFWRELRAKQATILEALELRAARTPSPYERQRLLRISQCAHILMDLLRPSGGGRQTAHKKKSNVGGTTV